VTPFNRLFEAPRWAFLALLVLTPSTLLGQGVTTGAMNGIVTDQQGVAVPEANIVAMHVPTGTEYRAFSRSGGVYNLPNLRVGGPYRLTVTAIGFEPNTQDIENLNLGQNLHVDVQLKRQAVQLAEVEAVGERDKVLNAGRTGAATFIGPELVDALPSIKRSTRDLTRLDPRSDGNFSFGGRNWLYNDISLDGSYFNNPFGLDDPAPGGQTNAEPVPYDAVEQVEVSVAPFDVRQGGFTGASINTVTKSGNNDLRANVYSFYRNDELEGNTVRGSPVVANPSLSYVQSGLALSGPIIRNKLFFYVNGELERTDDPGSNFVASRPGVTGFGVSRVDAATMDAISDRLRDQYGYETGPYQGYIHETDNNKILAKIDWNVNANNNLTFRWNYLDAKRDLPPHPFVFSFQNTGRGPNENSLPFRNAGYNINNDLNSFALELNSRGGRFANRFFASYNRFRDFRAPFSAPFPTIEIGQGGVTFTTAGHEPFSIHNILDQDVWQFTNNFTWFKGRHAFTLGGNFEHFGFFNSFNIFRNGVFFLPPPPASIGTTFSSVSDFMNATDPNNPNQIDLNGLIGTGPFKGENIDVGQLSFYLQDEFVVTPRFNLIYGLRLDMPMYFTDPVDNPFSRNLVARDENGNPETVDQSHLAGTQVMFSPRVGFNWNASGDRKTQIRGGTGIFTGRVPFVWVGNVISNPGSNPNLYPISSTQIPTKDDAILQTSFDLNAMDPNFKYPQVWTTDLAIDQQLGSGFLGTLEGIYSNDLKGVFVRNADLVAPVRTLPDGRPYYGGFGNSELNPDGGAGIYVIDNTSLGYSFNITAQLRKAFRFGLNASVAYSYTQAQNALRSTEIASVLWQSQPTPGDPNVPVSAPSEFGHKHRIVGAATYAKQWSRALRTQVGVFVEVADGNRFAGSGGNRYSFIYSGDVNGDGQGGNDLIYIPRNQSEIVLEPFVDVSGNTISVADQWNRLNAFIEQDPYLSKHRGQIAERFGAVNPWYNDVDLRVLQDFSFGGGGRRHTFQLSVDVLNIGNLIDSDWGVREVASSSATSPLSLSPTTPFDANGAPVLRFNGTSQTFVADPGLLSRWRAQLGVRYFLQ
jgi:Carboxypeptidase regulatory-like domain